MFDHGVTKLKTEQNDTTVGGWESRNNDNIFCKTKKCFCFGKFGVYLGQKQYNEKKSKINQERLTNYMRQCIIYFKKKYTCEDK